jgi:antibiotic biosynthesis monooxygenase (ABM) superfamily enzyme
LSPAQLKGEEMQSKSDVDAGPVTVCISVKVKRGREQDFETWVEGVGHTASQFAGHQGLNILRPSGRTAPDYVYIFRFDTYTHLKAWEDSEVRRDWVERLAALTEGEARKQVITGLEYWFTLPNAATTPPPPRYKMVIVTVLAIYPLSTILPPALGPFLAFLPTLLRGLLISTLLVLLMTYIVMPLLTRLFARWLFPTVRRKEA